MPSYLNVGLRKHDGVVGIYSPLEEVSEPCTVGVWGWITVVGSCLVHCRVCGSVPGLCSVDASSTLPL